MVEMMLVLPTFVFWIVHSLLIHFPAPSTLVSPGQEDHLNGRISMTTAHLKELVEVLQYIIVTSLLYNYCL